MTLTGQWSRLLSMFGMLMGGPTTGRRMCALVAGVLLLGFGRASAEEADTWARIGIPGESDRIQAVAIATDGTLYAGTDHHGVYRSGDAGLTWTAANAGIASANVYGLAIDPATPSIVFATTLSGLFRSSNGGTTWLQLTNGLTRTEMLSVAISPASSRVVYVGTDLGVFKSSDAGETWTASSNFPLIGVDAIAISDSAVYAGTIDVHRPGFPVGDGVFKSTDGGVTWVSAGLFGPVFGLAVDPAAPSTIFAAVLGGVYKSSSGGETWQQVLSASVSAVAVDPSRSATIYAGGFGAFRSMDGGSSWVPTNNGLIAPNGAPAAVLSLSLDRSRRVYAGAGAGGNGVFRAMFTEAGSCTADVGTLCLGGGRFQVNVSWQVPAQGLSGVGHQSALTSDTGAFWFFTPNNIELVVKVVDGKAFNGRFWVFAGALSDIQYTITVLDTTSGLRKTYSNPSGTLASFADTNAFPGP